MNNITVDYYLKNLAHRSPVPADCPAYTLVVHPKKKEWWNPDYVPYRGKSEWCVKCIIYGNYCDGYICKSTLSDKKDED